jgi:hypothetical protein
MLESKFIDVNAQDRDRRPLTGGIHGGALRLRQPIEPT